MAEFNIVKIDAKFPGLNDIIALSIGNPTELKVKNVLTEYESKERHIFGATTNSGLLVGILGLSITQESAEILHIAVLPEYRKKNVGSQLIQKAIRNLKIKQTIAKTDDDSVAFYHKLGFTCTPYLSEYGTTRYTCTLLLNIEIKLLKECANFIPDFAKIIKTELGQWLSEPPLDQIEMWLHDWLNENLPLALVAFFQDTPVGICSLQLNDGLDSAFKPWLGDLCVIKQFQRFGFGTQLVLQAEKKTLELGFNKIYLFTPDKSNHNFYTNLGYKVISTDKYNGKNVTILMKNL